VLLKFSKLVRRQKEGPPSSKIVGVLYLLPIGEWIRRAAEINRTV
jgi:hypothetical protein